MNELLSTTKTPDRTQPCTQKPSDSNDNPSSNNDFKSSMDKERKGLNNKDASSSDSKTNEENPAVTQDSPSASVAVEIVNPLTDISINTIKENRVTALIPIKNITPPAINSSISTPPPVVIPVPTMTIEPPATSQNGNHQKILNQPHQLSEKPLQAINKTKNAPPTNLNFTTQLNDNQDIQGMSEDKPAVNLNIKNIPIITKEDVLVKPTLISTTPSPTNSIEPSSDSKINTEVDGPIIQKSITERTHILDKKWPQNMAAKIALNSANGAQEIKVNINPGRMGPIEIQITQSESGMNFNILVSAASTKDLLDSYSQKIQQALTESGVDVGGFDINKQNKEESDSDKNNSTANDSSTDSYSAQSDEIETIRLHTGLLDSYA